MPTWRERIAEARVRGGFTPEDLHDADQWCSCAVGEQASVMPTVIKVGIFGPIDREMRRLGDADEGFAHAVRIGDVGAAEDLLEAIEDRALQLKRELTPA